MDFDIVTIGSATVDYFADTDSELIRIDTKTSHEELLAFPLGGKILINKLNVTTGGGGTNTATAFSRLGFQTAYAGKLGDDANGGFVLERLARDGITFLGARQGVTGVSFILNSIRDDRTILTFKGANDFLEPRDIGGFSAPWVYLSSMLKQSWQTVVDFVSAGNFQVAFNPSGYQARLGYQQLKPLVDRVAILVMNREEACHFLGRDPRQETDMGELIQALAKTPGQTVVITGGANGAWVHGERKIYAAKPREGLSILETTGAGDAIAATFTACHMRGLPLDTALDYAMTNAESVLQHKGAKERLLDWDSLREQARAGRRCMESWRV